MKDYDISQPLIFIHIPKTAGVSAREVFKNWYGDNFHRHYFNEAEGKLPEKIDILGLNTPRKPLCLYGHFNRLRGFGIEDYYPDARQFITILRDPFEQIISQYFYIKKVGGSWKNQSLIPSGDLSRYLEENKPNFLNHFPREVTLENYKDICEEYFIEIGITERLDESLNRIAKKLGFDYTISVKRLNATERDQPIPVQFRDQFVDLNRLEFEVYDYCLSKYI